jgi:hypothetical protein
LVFERLWQQTGCQQVIGRLLEQRKLAFPVERAVFLTVLHRLFPSGSDRAADKWKETIEEQGFEVDEAKIQEEARYDGKWVLRLNTDLPAAEGR